MTFENIIKKISQMLAITFMFVMADGYYLFQKGFDWVDGNLVLVRSAQAAVPVVDGSVVPSRFEMDEVRVLGNPAAPDRKSVV